MLCPATSLMRSSSAALHISGRFPDASGMLTVGQKPDTAPAVRFETATLAQAIGKLGYSANCKRCQNWVEVDLSKMAEKLGGTFPLVKLRPLLRCSECGAKDPITSCNDLNYFAFYTRPYIAQHRAERLSNISKPHLDGSGA